MIHYYSTHELDKPPKVGQFLLFPSLLPNYKVGHAIFKVRKVSGKRVYLSHVDKNGEELPRPEKHRHMDNALAVCDTAVEAYSIVLASTDHAQYNRAQFAAFKQHMESDWVNRLNILGCTMT